MPLLLVDGYNVINAWPDLKELSRDDLHAARVKLADILSDFVPWLWEKIIIVYDAYQVKGKPAVFQEGNNIEVVFTGEGQTADSFIERLITNLLNIGEDVEVVSSDYQEQNFVFWKGGRRISSRELKEILERSKSDLRKKFAPPPPRDLLSDRLSATLTMLLEQWRRL
jgi:predicted RNA-binding protein with PIN domain